MDDYTATEAVQRTAEVLDELIPGWADRIDLGRFDIGLCQQCVMGQVLGSDSDTAVEFLDHVAKITSMLDDRTTERFEDAVAASMRGSFDDDELNPLWVDEITRRQAVAR
jgi:hypothetical protein